MYEISVIGRSLNSENFQIMFEMLKDGEDAGKLHYQRYNADIAKMPDSDAYIFVGTRPKVTTKPYVHIQINDDEETIIAKVQELGAKLNAEKNNTNDAGDSSNSSGPSIRPDNDPGVDDVRTLRGVTLSIEGRDIRLNKDDMESLKSLMELCKEYNFKIKEVICE